MAIVTRKSGMREALERMAKDASSLTAKVGWFETAKYEDGTPVAYVAAIQEYGSGPIPPRSFFRTTQVEKSNRWRREMKGLFASVARGEMTTADGMELIGQAVEGDVSRKISEIHDPALSQSTIDARQRRGVTSVKPLVDTGTMLATLTHVVEKK